MKKVTILLLAFVATTALWAQNNVITYTASSKLQETTNEYTSGLYTKAFNVAITSHDFSNGQGTITFAGNVTKVGSSAFYRCSSISSVTIPNSVTSIGDYAFRNCSSLTSLIIPNSVISIGNYAFYDCYGLSSVNIGNSVTSIGDKAFYGCRSLSSVSIPNSVTSIGNEAFWYCSSLSSVSIGNSVTSIGEKAFRECTSLTTISIPNSVTSIGEWAFYNCSSLSSVSIGNSVTSIGEWAFNNCTSLTSVTIGNSVTSIGRYAFCNCTAIQSITIPNSVTSIGASAFERCSTITSVIIPDNVTSIGLRAFSRCTTLTTVAIGKSVTNVGDYTFENCTAITSVTWNAKNCTTYNFGSQVETFMFGNEVEIIPSQICSGMSMLTSIAIPQSVTRIGSSAFSGCASIRSVTCYATKPPICSSNCFDNVDKSIPLNVPAGSTSSYQTASQWKDFTNIQPLLKGQCGDNLYWQYGKGTLAISGIGKMYDYTQDSIPWIFFCDSISNIIIDNGATSIGDYAFYGCANKDFKTMDLPNSVTTIGQYAFANCTYLKYLTMGTDVGKIKAKAFDNDQKLLYVTCYTLEPPTLATDAFVNWDANLNVPCEAVADYKMSVGWKLFNKDNVTCIGAEPTTTTKVSVTPTENSATITWPTDANAESYTIEIKKDDVIFCTLTFNAKGQLTNIAFAPGRGSSNDIAMAEAVAGGYKFTVTSLTPATKYNYEIDTQNASGKSIANYNGSFTTKNPTALGELTDSPSDQFTKIIKDGQLLIIRDGKIYNAQGAEI